MKSSRMLPIILFSFGSFAAFSQPLENLVVEGIPPFPTTLKAEVAPYLEFRADFAAGPGGGGGGKLFLPLRQDRHALLFGDVRARVDGRTGDAGDGGTGAGAPADDGWTLRHRPRH